MIEPLIDAKYMYRVRCQACHHIYLRDRPNMSICPKCHQLNFSRTILGIITATNGTKTELGGSSGSRD